MQNIQLETVILQEMQLKFENFKRFLINIPDISQLYIQAINFCTLDKFITGLTQYKDKTMAQLINDICLKANIDLNSIDEPTKVKFTRYIEYFKMSNNPLEQLGFNMDKPSFFMTVNGKTGAGKSVFIKYLMREFSIHKPFDFGIVMSNTAWEGSFNYVPKKYVFEDFNEDILKNLIKIQKDNLSKSIEKRAFVLLDDCCSENKMKSPILKKLAIMGRHYLITVILSTQYVHLLPPVLRANSFYNVFFDLGQGRRELEACYNSYGQRFKNYDDFKQYYYDNINNHKFILFQHETGEYKTFRCPSTIPPFYLKYNKIVSKNKI